MVHSFKPTDTLVDVNQFILMNGTEGNAPYSLMTNFPRKVFTPADMDKTLSELGEFYCFFSISIHLCVLFRHHTGFVPSAVLILTKPQ